MCTCWQEAYGTWCPAQKRCCCVGVRTGWEMQCQLHKQPGHGGSISLRAPMVCILEYGILPVRMMSTGTRLVAGCARCVGAGDNQPCFTAVPARCLTWTTPCCAAVEFVVGAWQPISSLALAAPRAAAPCCALPSGVCCLHVPACCVLVLPHQCTVLDAIVPVAAGPLLLHILAMFEHQR